MNDELFIAFEISDVLEIFTVDRPTNASNCSSKVNDLRDPGAVASCVKDKCLYIMDQRRNNTRKKIFKIKPNGSVIETWARMTAIKVAFQSIEMAMLS